MSTKKKIETSYGYYSKMLQKPFDTLEELQAAELTVIQEREAKEAAAKARKTDAEEVEVAFKALNAARRAANQVYIEARDGYVKVCNEARKIYNDSVTAAKEAVAKAENDYRDAVKKFTEKHPEGYHMTLKDGDMVAEFSAESNTNDGQIVNAILAALGFDI